MGYNQETQTHWESRVECITATTAQQLAKKLNEAYQGKFCVGTHIFHENEGWAAFLYYKVKD